MHNLFFRAKRPLVFRWYVAFTLASTVLPLTGGAAGSVPRLLQAGSANEEKAKRSLAAAKQIVLACKLYAVDNDGAFPANLDALLPTYLDPTTLKKLLVSPFAPDQPVGYTYHAGLSDEASPASVLLEDKFAPQVIGQKIVVHVDCSGEITK